MRTRSVDAESTTVRTLRMRLNHAETRVKELETLHHPTRHLPKDQAELVTRLIATFTQLDQAAHPLRSTPIDGQTRYKHPDSTIDEGAATRWARQTIKQLTSRIRGAITDADNKLTGEWKPVEQPEKARCRNNQCPALDLHVPAWTTFRGGRTVFAERCSSCGNMLEKKKKTKNPDEEQG